MSSLKFDLWKGDCLELMKEIPNGSVDTVMCDLPYGTTQCSWDNIIHFETMWEQLKRVVKQNGVIALFGAEPFSSKLRCSNLKMFKYDWVWEKSKATGFLNSKKQPLRSHEIISVFYDKQPNYNPQMQLSTPYNKGVRKEQTDDDVYGSFSQVEVKNDTGLRYPRSVQYFKTAEHEGGFHKSQKPVALLEYLIKTYTNEGETVLDFTAGSFSTAIACLNTDRNFIGIELDDSYFDIGVNRIKEHIESNNMNVELTVKD